MKELEEVKKELFENIPVSKDFGLDYPLTLNAIIKFIYNKGVTDSAESAEIENYTELNGDEIFRVDEKSILKNLIP